MPRTAMSMSRPVPAHKELHLGLSEDELKWLTLPRDTNIMPCQSPQIQQGKSGMWYVIARAAAHPHAKAR